MSSGSTTIVLNDCCGSGHRGVTPISDNNQTDKAKSLSRRNQSKKNKKVITVLKLRWLNVGLNKRSRFNVKWNFAYRGVTPFGPPMWQAEADTELTLSASPTTAVGQKALALAKRRYSTVLSFLVFFFHDPCRVSHITQDFPNFIFLNFSPAVLLAFNPQAKTFSSKGCLAWYYTLAKTG